MVKVQPCLVYLLQRIASKTEVQRTLQVQAGKHFVKDLLSAYPLNSQVPLFSSPGYLCMTDEWFSEYVYEVVVDRKHVPEEVLAVLEQEPIVLPAWDPMGALAE